MSSSEIDRGFSLRDVAEIVIGSSVLAFPIAATEEVWSLSETLPLGRVTYICAWSVVFIAMFTYHRYFQGEGAWRDHVGQFALRVLGIYVITLLNVATILLALNQLLTVEFSIAVKRTVIVSFPASFAATIVDGMSRD